MKIACLQFASEVDNVADNINRADKLLSEAKNKLEDVDLLVLPSWRLLVCST
jgi:predicted amidohydrolase